MGLWPFIRRFPKEAREAAINRAFSAPRLRTRSKNVNAARREAARIHMLTDIALDARKGRTERRRYRWLLVFPSLNFTHICQKLGKVPVADIDQQDIRQGHPPIWHTKAATQQSNRPSKHRHATRGGAGLTWTCKRLKSQGALSNATPSNSVRAVVDVPAFYINPWAASQRAGLCDLS
jgi:hypothetical protein